MVLVNVITSAVLILALLFYRFIFPKKTIPYPAILFMISLLPLVSLLRKGTYESGDLTIHAMRTVTFSKILFDEHIRPVWTPNFNGDFGDPHFLFSYFLPYFLASILQKLGLSFIFSIKMLLAISYIFSGMFMYIWIKYEFGAKSAFIAAIFFLFAPYHLIDMHFRVTIAESMAFAFLPLCMYLASKIVKTLSVNSILLLGISLALLITTHQITSLFFIPILISYSGLIYFLKTKRLKREIFYLFSSVIIGFGLSSFYWLPIVLESRFTSISQSTSVTSFLSISELLYSPWRLGLLFQGHSGELSYLIGYTQLLVIVLASILCFRIKDRKIKITAIYFLLLLFTYIFLTLPYSGILWEKIPLLRYSQFPYRMLTFIALGVSVLSAILVKYSKSKIFFYFLITVTIFYTILNWGNRKTLPEINDDASLPLESTYLQPSSPIGTSANKDLILKRGNGKHVELVGNGTIKQLNRTSTIHGYLINSKEQITVKENTLCFPGWNIYINNKKEKLQCNDKATVEFKLPSGLYKFDLKFENTPDRTISNLISWFTLGLIIALFLLKRRFSFIGHNTNIPRRKKKRQRS